MSRRSREALLEADAKARHAAVTEFGRPVVLVAGAGTGKTTTLVARVVAWCLGPGWERAAASLPGASDERLAARVLDRIAAVTFTEAAAAEMAERSADVLAAVHAGEVPEGLPAGVLRRGDATLRSRALLGQADRLTVRTIHAWCRRVLAAWPFEAGLHPWFEVDADGSAAAEAARLAVEEAMSRGGGVPEADLLTLWRATLGPEALIDEIVSLREAGVRARDLEDDPFAPSRCRDVALDLRARCQALVAAGLSRLAGVKGASVSLRVHDSVTGLEAALARALGRPELDADVLVSLAEPAHQAAGERLDDWAAGKWIDKESAAFSGVLPPVQAAAARLSVALRAVAGLKPREAAAARRTATRLLATVEERTRGAGQVAHAELLWRTRDLLASHPDVLDALRNSLDQVLVDEFQDTDVVQCDIFRLLALDGDASQRPGLFVVGDPKQSIYGWRSADLAAFDAFVDAMLDGGGARFELVANYRSVPAILDEVERAVAPVMREENGVQPAFQPLVAVQEAKVGTAPAVEHAVSWSVDETGGLLPGRLTRTATAAAVEASGLAAELAEAHQTQHVAWGEMAVLLRSLSYVETYCSALRERGIPHVVGRDRSFYRRREIVEATALVATVLDPHDQVALVTTLRSALAGVPDAALVPAWIAGLPGRLADVREAGDSPSREAAAILRRVAGELPPSPRLARIDGWGDHAAAFVETLARLRSSARNEPADVFVERLRGLTLVEASEASRFLGAWRAANLDLFFRRLRVALVEGGGFAAATLRALRRGVAEALDAEQGRPAEAAQDAVQVLTIHGAKGLDFEHVHLVQAHATAAGRADAGPSVARVSWSGDGPAAAAEMRILTFASPGYYRVTEAARAREAAERVRTLYVAMTRAKSRLVVWGNWPSSPVPVTPKQASSHVELLGARSRTPADLAALGSQARDAGAWQHDDADGVRWSFQALRPPDSREAGGVEDAGLVVSLPEPGGLAALTELAEARAHATSRQERPLAGPLSATAHEALAEPLEGDEQEPDPDEPRRVASRSAGEGTGCGHATARAVGTAVHRLFERLDLAAPLEEGVRRAAGAAAEAAATASGNADAAERVRRVVGAFLEGGRVMDRLRALSAGVLARELPLCIAVAEGAAAGPVAVLAGAADLVARDPANGRVVVVDYKTDDVRDEASVTARTQLHAPQVRLYARAVGEALGLDRPPRAELWFLLADRVAVVDEGG